uniref:Uncharacterized protein n=1 Tax=Romanomermis culicivorax TaxID=13658 RepID=A0A915JWH4_ROMCU
MKTAWKLTKITLKTIAIGVGVPIIGLVLDVWDFKDPWENYQNGDQSALAVNDQLRLNMNQVQREPLDRNILNQCLNIGFSTICSMLLQCYQFPVFTKDCFSIKSR